MNPKFQSKILIVVCKFLWSSEYIPKCRQIQRGKLHGSIDVGLSVMSIKKRARRIDLDTEEHIYHLKVTLLMTHYITTTNNRQATEVRAHPLLPVQVKSQDIFDAWVSKLRHHRLYRQNEIVRSPREPTMRTFPPPAAIESPQPSPSVVNEIKVCVSFYLISQLKFNHEELFFTCNF